MSVASGQMVDHFRDRPRGWTAHWQRCCNAGARSASSEACCDSVTHIGNTTRAAGSGITHNLKLGSNQSLACFGPPFPDIRYEASCPPYSTKWQASSRTTSTT